MNSQPKWDIYESVVLLNGYLLACKKSEPRAYIIRRVSADLRAMAIHRGRKIDEIFRNENGISYQMQSVDSAYKGRKIYVPATKLFQETVSLYRNQNSRFQELLKEARYMLSASAHKFNGPKGIGFLYVRKGVELRPLNDGGAQEFGMRAGTENVASIVGMAKALEISCSALNENAEHILKLENALLERLKESGLDFVRNGARNHIPGNISVSFKDADGEAILHRLDLMGICVSTGSACDSVSTQISHVLKAIKLKDNYARGTIRISFGKENTFEEANIIAESLIRILKK